MKTLRAREQADEIVDAGVVVIGSGVAGLAAALSLSPRPVTLITKGPFARGGSSPWAQGGIAAAVADGDAPGLHALDTMEAGAGLCDRRAVDILTGEGPTRVRRLIEIGARFDRRPDGALALGREGAHSRRRILHAGGDQTGAEMVRALAAAVEADDAVTLHEHVFAMDLVRQDERVVGVLCRVGPAAGGEGEVARKVLYRASAVILASGGFGRLYAKTTNPKECTGDGLAMAARAGAVLADLEMVQFHPTALAVDVPGGTLPLVTEALRGEGAHLVDETGFRFMPAIHPDAELAPRDVVARAIWERRNAGHEVYLVARKVVGDAFPTRFPTVYDHCRNHGIDPRREPIPVTPAAHYAMAGVQCDDNGRTSLDGFWVAGEVSATGVHGANRLASNSLLEGLVYGHRVALDVVTRTPVVAAAQANLAYHAVIRRDEAVPDAAVQDDVRRLMWEKVALVRDGNGLAAALGRLESWATVDRDPDETVNLWTVARLVTAAALARCESRGSHFRSDYPEADEVWRRRLLWTYRSAGATPLQRATWQDAVDATLWNRPERVREIA